MSNAGYVQAMLNGTDPAKVRQTLQAIQDCHDGDWEAIKDKICFRDKSGNIDVALCESLRAQAGRKSCELLKIMHERLTDLDTLDLNQGSTFEQARAMDSYTWFMALGKQMGDKKNAERAGYESNLLNAYTFASSDYTKDRTLGSLENYKAVISELDYNAMINFIENPTQKGICDPNTYKFFSRINKAIWNQAKENYIAAHGVEPDHNVLTSMVGDFDGYVKNLSNAVNADRERAKATRAASEASQIGGTTRTTIENYSGKYQNFKDKPPMSQ